MEVFKDLEAEYTPSMFSKRFKNRDELLEHHIQFTAEGESLWWLFEQNFNTIFLGSSKNRENLDCHLNVAYGCTNRQKLDIYGEDLKPDAPLFVFIHGGFWQEVDKWNSSYVVGPFVHQGIRVMVIDYELCPRVTLYQVVQQVQKSFKWISQYVKDHKVENVSFAGHSAGAHLLVS